jgi:hypothetical protein
MLPPIRKIILAIQHQGNARMSQENKAAKGPHPYQTSILGGLIGYFALSQAMTALPYALGVSAASLLYVAVADLIPGMHRRVDLRASVWQVLLMAAGVGVIATLMHLFPH